MKKNNPTLEGKQFIIKNIHKMTDERLTPEQYRERKASAEAAALIQKKAELTRQIKAEEKHLKDLLKNWTNQGCNYTFTFLGQQRSKYAIDRQEFKVTGLKKKRAAMDNIK